MLPRINSSLILTWNHRRSVFRAISKAGLFLIICLWETALYFAFITSSTLLFMIEGISFITFLLVGLLYLLIVGRKGMFSNQSMFSLAMIPCFIPALLFCSLLLLKNIAPDTIYIGIIIWIVLSQWSYLLKIPRGKFAIKSMLIKVLFFLGLQCSYGLVLHSLYPKLLEPLESAIDFYDLKPAHQYLSKTKIQFFYDDKKEADMIEEQLPGVVDTLSQSPFYRGAEELILIQKPKMVMMDSLIENESYTDWDRIGGVHYGYKQYSYYFSEVSSPTSPMTDYYSHSIPHRAVVLHELTHQMLSRYYGKWYSLFFLETWKNEGYAEYMVGIDHYSTKEELRAILTSRDISDELLENPFLKGQYSIGFNNIGRNNYISAFLQTRYALDEKKISPKDFFESTYKIAPAQEIKAWLMISEETSQEEA